MKYRITFLLEDDHVLFQDAVEAAGGEDMLIKMSEETLKGVFDDAQKMADEQQPSLHLSFEHVEVVREYEE